MYNNVTNYNDISKIPGNAGKVIQEKFQAVIKKNN